MRKVILGMILLNQLVIGMDMPAASGQEQQSDPLVSVTNTREATVAQLLVNDLQNMIRNSVRESVSAVLGNQMVNTQDFQVALNVVSLRLRDAFSQQMNLQAVNFQNVLAREEENHRREIEARDAQLEEAQNERIRIEREGELKDLINGVYRSNPDDEFIRSNSFILGNAQEIRDIDDLSARRSQVEDIYNKVKLFSNLLGRENLGVEATANDLETVKSWLDRTNIDAILAKYGNFQFLVYNDEMFNGDWARNITFNGPGICEPLLNAKERLEGQISSLNGAARDVVLARLAGIFQRNEADDEVSAELRRPWHWRQHVWEVIYKKNGRELGYLWIEHQGAYWGESRGMFGNVSKQTKTGWLHWEDAWNEESKNAFQRDLNGTVEAIKNRAKLLFDFETNPESPLQRLYQESGQVNPSIIDFPSAEIDALVRQCNDFIRRTI